MSITKQRNKQMKSEWLKAYWKVYNKWELLRKELGMTHPMGKFSRRMIRVEAKKLSKGKK